LLFGFEIHGTMVVPATPYVSLRALEINLLVAS
jgi:hypothetical protein